MGLRLPSSGRKEAGLHLLHGIRGFEEEALGNGMVGTCASLSVETSRDGVATQTTAQCFDQANRDTQERLVARW